MARQAWNRDGGWDRGALEHIRAMLLVLAALIDRAASLPKVDRLRFLAVMGRGEAEVRCRIVAMASGGGYGDLAGSAALPETADDFACIPTMGSGDVALLAARFRMLALAVDAMLAQIDPWPSSRDDFPPLGFLACDPRRAEAQFTPTPGPRATSPPAAASATMIFLRTGTYAPVAIGAGDRDWFRACGRHCVPQLPDRPAKPVCLRYPG